MVIRVRVWGNWKIGVRVSGFNFLGFGGSGFGVSDFGFWVQGGGLIDRRWVAWAWRVWIMRFGVQE